MRPPRARVQGLYAVGIARAVRTPSGPGIPHSHSNTFFDPSGSFFNRAQKLRVSWDFQEHCERTAQAQTHTPLDRLTENLRATYPNGLLRVHA